MENIVLEHYGIKGMQWGIRKKSGSAPSGPQDVKTKITPGKKVKTSGGEGHSPHEDAVKTATAKQIAKKSSSDALSTNDLQQLVTRMNLETQYSKLSASTPGPVKKYVQMQMKEYGKYSIKQAGNYGAGMAVKAAMKKNPALGDAFQKLKK